METKTISADELIEYLGDIENLNTYEGCSTRITFDVKDPNLVNRDALKNHDKVVSLIEQGNSLIVVLGENTTQILDQMPEKDKLSEPKKDEEKQNIFKKLLGVLSGIFAPALTILAATGMIKGFLALFVFLNWIPEDSGTYTIIYSIGDCFFYFMPIFLGASTARHLGCNLFLGIAIGATLTYPMITALADQDAIVTIFDGTIFESQVYTYFFNIPVVFPNGGYVSTIIPVILAVFCAANLEKFWDRVLPEVLKGFLAPTLTLIIVLPLTFIIVGPIAIILSNILEAIAEALYNLSPILEGAFIGGFWQLMVMFGLHWAVIPIMMVNLSQNGYDAFLQAYAPACFAQAAACLAVFLKTKDQELKDVCIPAFVSGMFGITEPALYGVTLPRIKVFICTCIASAIGGAVLSMMQTKAFMFGGMGVFGFASYINPATGDLSSVYGFLYGSLIDFFLSFILTFLVYKRNETPKIA